MNTIYLTKGKANEYSEWALNIYNGCPHACFYCFAPNILHKDKAEFHGNVAPRKDIVKETEKYLKSRGFTGKTVHLCFTCDPYPTGYDCTPTREVIKLLKEHGNHVQILTKGSGAADFDLLDGEDWYGVTLDGSEMGGYPDLVESERFTGRFNDLKLAHSKGIRTWVSFEPVIRADSVLEMIRRVSPFIDKVKIGKLNYYPSDIDWKAFGQEAEQLCRSLGLNYGIKESLRDEMDK